MLPFLFSSFNIIISNILNITPQGFTFIFPKLGDHQSHAETLASVQITSGPHRRHPGNSDSASKKGAHHLLDPSGTTRKTSFPIKSDGTFLLQFSKKPVQSGARQ